MITYSIIRKSELGGAKRLDAEYYQPEYLGLDNISKTRDFVLLSEIAQVSGGKRLPLNENFSEKGIPYLRIVDISHTYVDLENIKYISDELHKKLKSYQIKEGDILVTIVGNSVGLIGYNQLNLEKFNFTENCARIRSKNISTEYLLSVLLSRIGNLQVEREKVGAAQPKLSLDRLRSFKIPQVDLNQQISIKEVIQNSINNFQKSKELYFKAESLLFEELGLKDFQPEEQLSYVVNFSEIKEAGRMDAEYFITEFSSAVSKIPIKFLRKLGEIVTFEKGFETGSEAYQEEGKLFIRVSSISKDGIIDKDQKYLSDEIYQKLEKDYRPSVGEILLTKDASPGVAVLIKEQIEGIISGGILRLKTREDIDGDYLELCLNSVVVQEQVKRDSGGSVIAHWKPEQIKNTLIPILPVKTREKIADLVRKSHEARKKSKELLEEAKRKVEEMIDSASSLQVKKGAN